MPNSKPDPTPKLMFSYGTGIFGRTVECYRIGDDFFLCGVTQHGDARVLPSLGMARELAASTMPSQEQRPASAAPITGLGVVGTGGHSGPPPQRSSSMTKLTDTQRVILSAASQRTDRLALPLPKSLKGGAAHKVVNALVDKGLLKEVKANRKLNDLVWRESDDGHGLTLIITDAGFAAIGIEVEPRKPKARKPEPKPATAERKTREGTKQALVIEMLRRPEGVTIPEIVEATCWASHSVRGFMAGTLKKKLGLTISSDKDEARGRVYSIVSRS